ncbi:FeoC-like transcriptional regulator [Pseudomonas aeruginosa]|uniref:FeoC-like transcriptional regulator n=5 Tax=Pseudomonas aeruginosa TaxID=287 RepID=UPI003D760EFC
MSLMATLMQIRAALEDGQARGLKQLSRQVDAPPALVEAILERLIALGKVERVAAQSSGGCGGGCKGCAQRDPCAERPLHRQPGPGRTPALRGRR